MWSGVRGQRSEVRGQRSEVRGQRSEVRGQRSEVRGPAFEVQLPTSDIRLPTSDFRQPTSDNRLPTSDSDLPLPSATHLLTLRCWQRLLVCIHLLRPKGLFCGFRRCVLLHHLDAIAVGKTILAKYDHLVARL